MKQGNVKLCDFGFAKEMKSNSFFTSMKGTPLYIAPEMINSNIKYDFKVDIWAFGIILYEMATGKTPFYEV